MTRIKKMSGLLVLTICLLAGETALAGNITGVAFYGSEVQVDVTDKPLCSLLREISSLESFSCPSTLQQIHVSIQFQASDRFSALWRLLREYNIVGVWDEEDNLSRVYLLGSSGQSAIRESVYSPGMDISVSELQKLGRSSLGKPSVYFLGTNGQTAPPPKKAYSPGMDLSVSELRKLGRLSFKKPLPQEVFYSPAYQPLFRLGGISSPQDWLTVAKALQVKRHISQVIRLKTSH